MVRSVYEATGKPLLSRVMDGYNATIFCYGATGTGKTHTMHGAVSLDGTLAPQAERGMYVHAAEDLFSRIQASHSQQLSY